MPEYKTRDEIAAYMGKRVEIEADVPQYKGGLLRETVVGVVEAVKGRRGGPVVIVAAEQRRPSTFVVSVSNVLSIREVPDAT